MAAEPVAGAMNTLAYMHDAVFMDGPDAGQKRSRFWLLLVLASVIAAAGVVGDSTATVIGAMIVAPLMTPILGMMLAVVLGDRANLARSAWLVVAGAVVAVGIGYLVGLVVPADVVAQTNGQVAARIHPRLIDLLAALATGAVGSIALARRDISDTLPGVAIAISLVPPLSVVGLTLEAGATGEAAGALLLFTTNVAAILGAGTVVMGIYGVHRLVVSVDPGERVVNRRRALALIAVMVLAVGAVLAQSSRTISRDRVREGRVARVTSSWAGTNHWRLVDVVTQDDKVVVRAAGPPPLPSTRGLAQQLARAGVDPSTVEIQLVPGTIIELRRPGS